MCSLTKRPLKGGSQTFFLRPRARGSGQEGFALMEVMIALMIVGLLGGMVLPLFKQVQKYQEREATLRHQERIFFALSAFLQTHHRLPCPHDPGEKKARGYERRRCQKPGQEKGHVPYKTLGLTEKEARVGKGGFFTYVVHPELTITRSFKAYCAPEVRPLLSPSVEAEGRSLEAEGGSLEAEGRSLEAEGGIFDPIAVLLIDPAPGPGRGKGFSSPRVRWETRKNLAAFYGRLFCADLGQDLP